jgi:hypothetical protein
VFHQYRFSVYRQIRSSRTFSLLVPHMGYALSKVGHKSGIILTTCNIDITLTEAWDFLESNTTFALLVRISFLQVSSHRPEAFSRNREKKRGALWKKIDRLVLIDFSYLWITCYSGFLMYVLLMVCLIANKRAYSIPEPPFIYEVEWIFFYIDFERVQTKALLEVDKKHSFSFQLTMILFILEGFLLYL